MKGNQVKRNELILIPETLTPQKFVKDCHVASLRRFLHRGFWGCHFLLFIDFTDCRDLSFRDCPFAMGGCMGRTGRGSGPGFVLTQLCAASRAEVCCTGKLLPAVVAELWTFRVGIVRGWFLGGIFRDGGRLFRRGMFRHVPYRFAHRFFNWKHLRLPYRCMQRALHRVPHCRVHFGFFHRLRFDFSTGRSLAGKGDRGGLSFHWLLHHPEMGAPVWFFRFFFFRFGFRHPVTGEQPLYRWLFLVIFYWLLRGV